VVEPAETQLEIRLLGGFAVSVQGCPVPDEDWRLRRAKSLVKLLALAPERRLHREQLVEWLWPGDEPSGKGLHQVLYTARRALGEEAGARLALRDDVVTLGGDSMRVDVDAFEAAAATAREGPSVQRHHAAIELYTGELLPEDRYEDWTTARRESLRETYKGLLVELADLQAGAGDTTAAIETLQHAVIEDPLYEVAHRGLMRLFADAGRRQQALWQYETLRDSLRRELEADPDPETRALYRELLSGGVETSEEPAPAPAPVASSLPQQLTSFVGRRRELSELEQVLAHARLLTLTGPGGCGKTRLSLELAARCEERFDGVGVVELAPVADPALVVEETAMALGVQQRSERDPAEVLAERIGEQRLLVVLDNCEHLIEACAQLADRLLRACPNLHVLATSRERLRIQGEVAWRVPPLSLPVELEEPDVDQLERSEAIRLFCQRAADAAPGFELTAENAAAVADICRRLDGMPLALELAAARASALSPNEIRDRLGDALALLAGGSRVGLTRQQTLRGALAWSHDLLSEQEKTLYRRLGVFAGSFDVASVEGFCSEGGLAALELLVQLVEKSLVQVERGIAGTRYRLLETVRQDARERLAAAGESGRVGELHRSWFLELAERADRDINPEAAREWPPERLELEHDDLRAALASAIRHDPPTAVRLANAMWWFWMARGLFVEGSRWLSDVLDASPEATAERARALIALGAIQVRRPVPMHTVELGREALAIARRSGDRHAEARALERLGVMAMGSFEWDIADPVLADGLALAREIGDEAVQVAIRHNQGILAGCRGDNKLARALLGDCLELLGGISDEDAPLLWAAHVNPVIVPAVPGGPMRSFFEDTFLLFRAVRCRAAAAYTLVSIGETWRSDGEYAAAAEAMGQALELFDYLEDDLGRSLTLNALGNLARSTGDVELGQRRFEEALALRSAAGDPRETAMTLIGMGMLAISAGDREAGLERVEEALAIFERTDDGPGLEGTPLNLGGFELDGGDAERACELLQQCIDLAKRQGLNRNRGWAAAGLAEAALQLGNLELARRALDDAFDVLSHTSHTRGLQYARELEQRLATAATP
jgi:predicted ATPase/DNA-binding SARP family transcriptional activator